MEKSFPALSLPRKKVERVGGKGRWKTIPHAHPYGVRFVHGRHPGNGWRGGEREGGGWHRPGIGGERSAVGTSPPSTAGPAALLPSGEGVGTVGQPSPRSGHPAAPTASSPTATAATNPAPTAPTGRNFAAWRHSLPPAPALRAGY